MANEFIKKVVVPSATLLSTSGNENGHLVRFRIISEDRNRTSHWSPIYTVNPYPVDTNEVEYSIDISIPRVGNSVANIFWKVPELFENSSFDIYAKWMSTLNGQNNHEWTYLGTRQGTSFSAVIPTNTLNISNNTEEPTTHFIIAVQTLTYPKEIFTTSTVFESTTVTI